MNAAPKTPGLFDDLDEALPVQGTPIGPRADQLARIDVAAGLSLGTRASTIENRNQVAQFKCKHCNGSGRFVRGFHNPIDYGPCNRCHGTGRVKTDPQVLAAQRQARTDAKQRRVASYLEAHKPEHDWCTSRAPTFGFAASMLDAVRRYGEWTDGQLAGIRKCIQGDVDRAKAREEQLAQTRTDPQAQVSGAGFERMLAAFAKAKATGLKYPKFTAGAVTFALASDRSKYAGKALFVKLTDEGTYLGRIELASRAFFASRDCDTSARAQVATICRDPFAAAVLHGKQTGRCSCCGRELENEESVRLGIGPICRERWGL